MVGPVGAVVGAKEGPVAMKVTPAGNLSFGIAHHLRYRLSYNANMRNTRLVGSRSVCSPRMVDRLQASAVTENVFPEGRHTPNKM